MEEEDTSSMKSITIELKVYMHCDACERRVCNAIGQVEGVETIEVDREENKVTVTGGFEQEKVVKKIKKKIGKKAEILTPKEDEEEETGEEPYVPFHYNDPVVYHDVDVPEEFQSYIPDRWNFHYFDDEDAQACMVM